MDIKLGIRIATAYMKNLLKLGSFMSLRHQVKMKNTGIPFQKVNLLKNTVNLLFTIISIVLFFN